MPDLTHSRLLIVEDDVLLAWDLERTLYAHGALSVTSVTVPEKALHELDRWRPTAAILDVKLRDGRKSFPVADALDGLRIPFIFLSGYSPEALPERHRKQAFLQKPCNPKLVARTLREVTVPATAGA